MNKLKELNQITPELLIAVRHVREHFPEVDHVFFSLDGRWMYCDGVDGVDFAGKIDIGLMEDASDSLEDLPAAFYLGDIE